MSDEYAKVARGKLKLKTDGEISKKKKKKKDKEKERVDKIMAEVGTSKPASELTKAELSFKKMQDKMVNFYSDKIEKNKQFKNISFSKRKGSLKKLRRLTNNKWKSSMRSLTILPSISTSRKSVGQNKFFHLYFIL
jgi:hypothetical protein